jgi:hypothetical protein
VLNSNPTFFDMTITPSPAGVGDVMTCEATVIDADGEAPTVVYEWSSGTTGPTYTATSADLLAGSVYCAATATDLDGGSASDTVFAAVSNDAPTINSISISPEEPQVGDTVRCDVSATDADGDDLSTAIVWSTGATGPTLYIPVAVAVGTEVTCTATVSDPGGESDSADATVAIVNTPPIISRVAIEVVDGDEVTIGAELKCEGDVEEINTGDRADVFYAWENATSERPLGSTQFLVLDRASASAGDAIRCTVSATDTLGGESMDMAEVILDTTALTVTASVDDVITGGETTCTASASSAGATVPASFDFSWTVDDVSVSADDYNIVGSSSTLFADLTRGDNVVCSVSGDDGSGGEDSASAEVTVGNAAPEIVSVIFSPEDATVADTQVASFEGTDPEDDMLEGLYSWTWRTGSWDGNRLDLATTDLAKGDEYSLSLVVGDGYDGTATYSRTLVLVNSEPTVSRVNIEGETTGVVGSRATCVYDWVDSDRSDTDRSTVSWIVQSESGDVTVYEAVGAEWTITGNIGDSYLCSVIPSDGEYTGEAVISDRTLIDRDEDEDDTTDASEDAPEEFALLDVNTTSPTYGAVINPRDYLGQVSAYYFGHAT